MDFQNIWVAFLEPYLAIDRKILQACLVAMGAAFGVRLTWIRAQIVSYPLARNYKEVLTISVSVSLFFLNECNKNTIFIDFP